MRDLYSKNGYTTVPQSVDAVYKLLMHEVGQIINHYFSDTKVWASLSSSDFYSYCFKCQQEINNLNFQSVFIQSHENILSSITGMSDIWHESVVFLRAIRPLASTPTLDNVGLHRETMYTDSPVQTSLAHNIWIPLTSITQENAVRYVPGSHLIPDHDLEWTDDLEANSVAKGSDGHKLGMLYKPRKITSNLSHLAVSYMLPSLDEFCLFSAMTLHGAGKNCTDNLRISLSMATIDKSVIETNKAYQASNGKPHYIAHST